LRPHDTGNGYIEGAELDGFLREFVTSVNPDTNQTTQVGQLNRPLLSSLVFLSILLLSELPSFSGHMTRYLYECDENMLICLDNR
jgi:hypothetical protein